MHFLLFVSCFDKNGFCFAEYFTAEKFLNTLKINFEKHFVKKY